MAASPRTFDVIVLGGIVVAVLDIANAMTFWYLYRGTNPLVILQSVAAGLLGREAFSGGVPTAALGAFLHTSIAFAIAAVFLLACRLWPVALERPLFYGAVYGAGVYLVMNHIVVPLSRATPVPFYPAWFLDNVIGHILLVGMPLGLIASRSKARA